ncbi:MAG: malate synthase [Balneolales bacterium]|nr:malate synthase [Balneolales bacterium]
MEQDLKEINTLNLPKGLHITDRALSSKAKRIFTSENLRQLVSLHHTFKEPRRELLLARKERQQAFDNGAIPEYLPAGTEAASGNWIVNPIPADLRKRRVEITGPVNSAKMVINMLSRNEEGYRADMAMLDFEDSMKPSWDNVLDGILNVKGASEGNLSFQDPGKPDKVYRLDPDDMAGVMVRVRGLHLEESNILIDGEPVSAGLFDIWMSSWVMVRQQIKRGKTPKFYVPKCEHYLEARWWNQLLSAIEDYFKLSPGTIKTTFLIETLTAAFQIEEILFELRERAAGLNVGRWDKIFSDIKVLKTHRDRIMEDRATINMHKFWMDNYAKRLIKICHSRGAFAIGGMSAFTPGKTEEIRKDQTSRVIADKGYEAAIGHDGCWVSHPYFIGYALKEFTNDNQLSRTLDEFDKYPDLIPDSNGACTIKGLKTNIRVGIAYIQGWNKDIGCVAWDGLMEDLATLEISRAQTWQWMHHKIVLDDETPVTPQLIKSLFEEELQKIILEIKDEYEKSNPELCKKLINEFSVAAADAERIFTAKELADFLTTTSDLV